MSEIESRTEIIDEDQDDRPGIQSVEIGLQLMRTLVEAGVPLGLTEISNRNGMHRSKVHRYFVSLCRSGLAEQDAFANYRLGPFALRMGLTALTSISPLAVASSHLERLAGELGKTVALCMWVDGGPIYVEWKGSASTPVTLNIRLGATMPILHSAAGRLFGTFIRPDKVKPLLDAQLRHEARVRGIELSVARHEYETIRAEVRKHGIARVHGDFQRDIDALSVPIFDHRGLIVFGLTVIASAGSFDVSFDGKIARDLKRAAAQISHKLGAITEA